MLHQRSAESDEKDLPHGLQYLAETLNPNVVPRLGGLPIFLVTGRIMGLSKEGYNYLNYLIGVYNFL